MVTLVHPGTQHSFHLARQLVRHKKLSEFWTGLALAEDAWYARMACYLMPESLCAKVSSRLVHDVPAAFLRAKPFLGLKAIYQTRRGRSPQEVFHTTNGQFQ